MGALRRYLALLLSLLLLACLSWEIYDPPGEDIPLLSCQLSSFVVELQGGRQLNMGSCSVEVSVFLDPGRPGISLILKISCTLQRSPPPGESYLYARDLLCHVEVYLSGEEVAEGDLPVGGLVVEAPWMAGCQLVDAHEPSPHGFLKGREEVFEEAEGILEVLVRAEVKKVGDEGVVAEGSTSRTVIIPPSWALPLTATLFCVLLLAIFFPRSPRAVGGEVSPPSP